MTTTQVAYWNLQEQKRSNRVQELETHRTNLAKESETNRSNLVKESQTKRELDQNAPLKTAQTVQAYAKSVESVTKSFTNITSGLKSFRVK